MMWPRVGGLGMGRGEWCVHNHQHNFKEVHKYHWNVSAPSVCCILHSGGTHVPKCVGEPVYTHRADCMQKAKHSNLCKQRKHGNRAQTELARRYGQGNWASAGHARTMDTGMCTDAVNMCAHAKGFVNVDFINVNAAGNLRA